MNQPPDRLFVSSYILNELEQAVLRVLNRRLPDLSVASAAHTSVENLWLQSDLAKELSRRPGIELTVETPVAAHGRVKRVDLVVSTGSIRRLVELKAMPTNYGLAGKNITQSRDALRSDLRALGERLNEHTDACLVWLAYPIPSERDGDWQANHLRHVNRDAESTRRIARINVGQADVHAYISEARQPASVVAT